MVRFHDNAHAKRKFPGNNSRKAGAEPQNAGSVISYSEMAGGGNGV